MATFSKDDLNSMTRPQLQRLCKDFNIKANLRTDQIVDLLSKRAIHSDELAPAPCQEEPFEPTRSRLLRRSLSQPSLMPQPSTKSASSTAAANVASHTRAHSRTSSRDTTKPTTRVIPERKPPPTSMLARSSSRNANFGKENGASGTNVAKSQIPEPKTVGQTLAASTSAPTKTIAGRMAALALGRAPTTKLADKNTNATASTSSTRIAGPTSKQLTSSIVETAIDNRCKEIEQTSERRWNEVTALIGALTERMTKAEETAQNLQLNLESRDAEIDVLRTDVQEAQAEAARQIAISDSLVQMLEHQTRRTEELETKLQSTTDTLASLKTCFNDTIAQRNEAQADVESRVQTLEAKVTDLSKPLPSTKPSSHLQTPSVGSRIKSQNSQTFSNVTNNNLGENMNWSPQCLSNISNPYLDLASELDLTATPAGRRSRIARSLTTPMASGIGELGFIMGDTVMAQYNGFSRHGEDSPSFMTFEGTNRAYL